MANNSCAGVNDHINADSLCLPNLGGISLVWLANYSDIASYGLTGATSAVTPLGSQIIQILGPGGTGATVGFFYDFTPARNSGGFTETQSGNIAEGSVFYDQNLTLAYRRLDQPKRDQFALLSKSTVVAIVKDGNDNYWLLGKNEGLYVSAFEASTGVAKTDINGYTMTLTSQEANNMYIVSPNVSGGGTLSGIDDLLAP